jgi:ABC-type antimicrobial peptide transport system permease subunit
MALTSEKAWLWIGIIAILLFSIIGGLISFLFTAWLIFWTYKLEEHDCDPKKHPVWAQMCTIILLLSFIVAATTFYINAVMIFSFIMGILYSFLYSRHIHQPKAW